MISQAELKKIIHYDPLTGKMTRISTGKEVGYMNHYGRVIVTVDFLRIWKAKLAWYWMTGIMPDEIGVLSKRDDHPSNFKWDRMFNEKGESLEEVMKRMEKKRGKTGVQSNGGTDRKADHRPRHPKGQLGRVGGGEKVPAHGNRRGRTGDHR